MDDKKKQQQKLNLKEGQSTFKMIIPTSVEAKIRHICSIIHDVEWSGVLFYSHTGSIEENNFEIKCEDIYVMDIGSGGYTEYKENASILDYRIQNNLLTEVIQEGLIHSHNNMSTFFSGTDRDTLIEEGTNSNHFVSLIVNNAGSYTARMTRKVTRELKAKAHITYEADEYYNSYGDNKIVLNEGRKWEEDREETKTIQEIEYFNLDIEKHAADNEFTELDNRLREIKEAKEKEASKKRYPYLITYNKDKYKKEPEPWKQKQIFPTEDYYNDDFYDNYYDYKYSKEHNYKSYEEYINKAYEDSKEKDTEEDYEEVPLCMTEDATPELIKTLAAQLLSGDITTTPDKFKFEEFIATMDSTYENKFGPLIEDDYPNVSSEIIDDNNKNLETWITSMTDYIVYTEDKTLLKNLQKKYGRTFTEIDTAEVIAMDLWRYLDDLPESYVKEKIMDTLMDYIPDGAKEYF